MRSSGAATSSSSAPAQRFDFTHTSSRLVSRIYTFSPREGERYFPRIFLFHVSGEKSFPDFRTVNGNFAGVSGRHLNVVVFWHPTMSEGEPFPLRLVPAALHSPRSLTPNCNTSSPSALWTEHKAMFISDILQRLRQHMHALHSDDDAGSRVKFRFISQV